MPLGRVIGRPKELSTGKASHQQKAASLTNFANGHLEVALVPRVGLFLLKGVQVARHPGEAGK